MQDQPTRSSGYWQTLGQGLATAYTGLRATLGHALRIGRGKTVQEVRQAGYFADDGAVTLQYPHEQLQVPPLGRYKLDCEIDDCIVCDKCARVCPVDCIAIETVKSPTEWGQTSDGTGKRLYASKFEIDMAKCCYCGLCTTVCPTECLVMTPEYDFSASELSAFTFQFATLSPEEADQKRLAYEQFQAEKAAAAAAKKAAAPAPEPAPTPTQPEGAASDTAQATPKKVVFKPIIKKKPE